MILALDSFLSHPFGAALSLSICLIASRFRYLVERSPGAAHDPLERGPASHEFSDVANDPTQVVEGANRDSHLCHHRSQVTIAQPEPPIPRTHRSASSANQRFANKGLRLGLCFRILKNHPQPDCNRTPRFPHRDEFCYGLRQRIRHCARSLHFLCVPPN